MDAPKSTFKEKLVDACGAVYYQIKMKAKNGVKIVCVSP